MPLQPRPPWLTPILYNDGPFWHAVSAVDTEAAASEPAASVSSEAIAGGAARPSRLIAAAPDEAEGVASMEAEAVVAVHDAREADGRLEEVRRWLVRSGIAAADVVEVLVGLARIERTYRRDRQAAGIAVARRNGVYKGRAQGTTKAKPDRAKELQAKGMSAPEIGRALGVSIRTVFRYLSAGE